uniref:Kinesin-like protein unc-104 n=1 Tax=Ursus americanus TaxID=9643 RepID=A0A452SQG9_URSAM
MDESVREKYAGQDDVFKCLGENILQNAFDGYNACIFAYGQTGSGKSYTMMGTADQPGLIPRLCSGLFERTQKEENEEQSFKVEVSYMEIYNEKVRDLLDPKGSRQTLKVREHNVLGPYVDGLSKLAVTSYKDIESLMSEGNKSRTVAATNMNEESSRSHAVFKITLTHTLYDVKSGTSGEKVGKLSLVDLAGSERATKTGAAGDRLKEGSNINKSLTTLGLVISALADQSAGKNKNKFVPYRDSVLTWLLKDSLGGNSKTAMVATVSPAADNRRNPLHSRYGRSPHRRIRGAIQKVTVTWRRKLRKTEEIERQKQLESLGISLQSSGIKVGDDKCFLVNLNADPALNELLVYYLKEHTLIGSANSQDIQLCGMGILPEHCIIDITAEGQVMLTPQKNTRTFVNGSSVSSPIQLHHGDRILWGNNHFFRYDIIHEDEEHDTSMKNDTSSEQLDVDGDSSSEVSSEINFNYEYAQMEVTMKALGNNDPMQSILNSLEQQHEEEKRSALERQRLMYEHELEQLRRRLSPEKQNCRSGDRFSFHSPSAQQRLRQWAEEREATLNNSLMRLREQIVKANLLVREASYIAEELDKRTEYKVTLQIPASSLDANRKRGSLLSEPAIQVRRKGKGKQIWSLEKLDNRLLDMRDLYQEWKECEEDTPLIRSYFKRADPFYDEQENHSLIGVANVFLESLFYDVKLQYAVPIVNQKGEVAGRLHVEVMRISGDVGERIAGGDDTTDLSCDKETQENRLVCMVKILQATGLPQHLSHFVFCKYNFWDQQEPVIVAPEVDTSSSSPVSKEPQCMVVFDHCNFSVNITEDFIEHLSEGALAIEVYGHKMNDPRKNPALWDLGIIQAKTRSLRDRWSEVTRKVEFWVQILEQNENGEYCPVEVISAKDVPTGGIFQLRQGQSRRVQVEVKSVQESGTLPLMEECILSVGIGCVKVRTLRSPKTHETFHVSFCISYDRDLERLRRKWLNALTKRQEYLDQQLQKLVSKHDKTEDDADREAQLLEMRLTLTEERNAVMVPSAGSGIPGAPAEWTPVPGMETHIPVIFLDLNGNFFVFRRRGKSMFFLSRQVRAEASWDSAVHSCPQLSKGTPADERVYLIVRVTVQLSHPADMQLVLRKRICVHVHGRSFYVSFYRVLNFNTQLSVLQDAQGVEERETLARMAANVENTASADSEAYIEKYLRSVLAVENLLTLDRLRQVSQQRLGSLAASYLNPVKSFVPQMPKLLKSLFPVRDEKRAANSDANQVPLHAFLLQAHRESVGISAAPLVTVHPAPMKPYDRATKVPAPQAAAASTQAPEVQEGPPSPLSEASSGYFSHSVSSATLSDAFIPGLDGAAAAGGQTPGSPPPALCQASPETELPVPATAPAADGGLSAHMDGQSSLLSLPVPAEQNAWGAGNGTREAKRAVSSEKEDTSAPPTPLLTCAPQKESCSRQRGGEVSPATKRLRRPEEHAKPAAGSELEVSKPQAPPDLLCPSPAPASPFRIQKVRTSELKSFTRMLGGDPSCPSAADEDLLASGALGDGGAGTPALGKLEVSSDSEEASEVPEWLKEGEYVTVGTNKMGIVRYIGPTDFQEGTWIGVELDLPSGKNDGSIGGKQYFKCNPGYGLLVRPGRVRRAAGSGRRRSAGLRLQGAPEPRRSSTLSGSATNLASLTAALAKAEGATVLKADRSHKNPENRKSWAS